MYEIIDSERFMLRYDADYYSKDNPQAVKSINEAIKELDGAFKALEVVQNKDQYMAVDKAH